MRGGSCRRCGPRPAPSRSSCCAPGVRPSCSTAASMRTRPRPTRCSMRPCGGRAPYACAATRNSSRRPGSCRWASCREATTSLSSPTATVRARWRPTALPTAVSRSRCCRRRPRRSSRHCCRRTSRSAIRSTCAATRHRSGWPPPSRPRWRTRTSTRCSRCTSSAPRRGPPTWRAPWPRSHGRRRSPCSARGWAPSAAARFATRSKRAAFPISTPPSTRSRRSRSSRPTGTTRSGCWRCRHRSRSRSRRTRPRPSVCARKPAPPTTRCSPIGRRSGCCGHSACRSRSRCPRTRSRRRSRPRAAWAIRLRSSSTYRACDRAHRCRPTRSSAPTCATGAR